MKIAIIGSGNVGGTLGARWAQAGHDVIFGSRNPASDAMRQLTAKAGATTRAASFAEAPAAAELLLLATPWPATKAVLEGLGDLAGKVLIDATNPLLPDLSAVEYGTITSGAEHVAEWARGAKVVKAFNTVGYNIMANPVFGGDRPVMFYCGDNGAAKQTVRPLIEQLGFEAVDAGPLSRARLLEPFALLWISLAYAQGQGREIGFKLLRR
ncbi:MAG TPA: NADPH-dependent F420 reductase [Bryobacteraceae bacterium]|nr:NADPH-dependent F420 reductase [Bryobacteraceae bacterium]